MKLIFFIPVTVRPVILFKSNVVAQFSAVQTMNIVVKDILNKSVRVYAY